MVMVWLTGLGSAGFAAALLLLLPGVAAPLPALPFAAFGSGVADAVGVPELLEHPTTRHSASSVATCTIRKVFMNTPYGYIVSIWRL